MTLDLLQALFIVLLCFILTYYAYTKGDVICKVFMFVMDCLAIFLLPFYILTKLMVFSYNTCLYIQAIIVILVFLSLFTAWLIKVPYKNNKMSLYDKFFFVGAIFVVCYLPALTSIIFFIFKIQHNL